MQSTWRRRPTVPVLHQRHGAPIMEASKFWLFFKSNIFIFFQKVKIIFFLKNREECELSRHSLTGETCHWVTPPGLYYMPRIYYMVYALYNIYIYIYYIFIFFIFFHIVFYHSSTQGFNSTTSKPPFAFSTCSSQVAYFFFENFDFFWKFWFFLKILFLF